MGRIESGRDNGNQGRLDQRRIDPGRSDHSHDSIIELVTGLLGDARDLAATHVESVRMETLSELRNLKHATQLFGIGLAVMSVAVVMAALGGALALATYTVVPLWGAVLIAAAVLLIAGLLVFKAAAKPKEEIDLVPEDSLEHAKDDASWIADRAREVVHADDHH
jgi:putative superfamily III holin-X